MQETSNPENPHCPINRHTKVDNPMERNLDEQPIAHILAENKLTNGDLVSASTENITYKMVARACKGRRLTPHVQLKICNALSRATGKTFTVKDLFNY